MLGNILGGKIIIPVLLPDNSNIKKIFELVKGEKLNITEISERIKLSYKNTFFHIKKLEEYGLIRKEVDHTSRGKKTYIIPTGKTLKTFEEEELTKIKKKLKEELKKL
jgi:predicted transcriptional regulator